jgi:UDP-N-acetylmuramoylalanine--D-glutamate ligase
MPPHRFLLWGIGRENQAYLQYLEQTAWDGEVLLFDEGERTPEQVEFLSRLRFAVSAVSDVDDALKTVDLLMRSPGVSPYKASIQRFLKAGGQTTTPTAVALRLLKSRGIRVVGVTGTNGKSSTCTMLGCVFAAAAQTCIVAGNIGKPLISLLDDGTDLSDLLIVLELSSYQIFDLDIAPDYLIFLNLFVDHVEWHKTDVNYKADKLSILTKPGILQSFVHPDVFNLCSKEAGNISTFAIPSDTEKNEQRLNHGTSQIDLNGSIAGANHHMLQNASAVAAMAGTLGISGDVIEKGLRAFAGLDHRLQVIGQIEGTTFVDDSISTTPESVLAALDSFPGKRVHLFLGGYDRGLDYASLLTAMSNYKIATLILMGDVGKRLRAEIENLHPAPTALNIKTVKDLCQSLDGVHFAQDDVVLLSPGASSFDSYRDYIHRGQAFAEEVARATSKRGA